MVPARYDKGPKFRVRHPEVPRRDAYHKTVPSWLQKIFIGRQWLMWWVRRLDRMERDLAKMQDESYTKHLDVPQLQSQLRTMRETISRNIPYARCPEPNCSATCLRCKGDRWVTAKTLAGPIKPTPV